MTILSADILAQRQGVPSFLFRLRTPWMAWTTALWMVVAIWSLSILTAHAQRFSTRVLGNADTFPTKVVGCTHRDRKGFLWLCTESGLVRYDGTSFERYDAQRGIDHLMINSINESPDGKLWAMSTRALFVGDEKGFSPVIPLDHPELLRKMSEILVISTDEVLVLAGEDLYTLQRGPGATGWTIRPTFDPEQRASLAALNHVHSIKKTNHEAILLGCGAGLCELSQGKVRYVGIEHGLPEDRWIGLLITRSGTIYLRGTNSLAAMSPAFTDPVIIRLPPVAPLVRNTDPVEDPQGRVLVLTSEGIARIAGDRVELLNSDKGLPDMELASILFDDKDDMFVGSRGAGLVQVLMYSTFDSWTKSQGLRSNDVWSILRDAQGRLLVGTSKGCQGIDEAAGRVIDCPWTGLPQSDLHGIAAAPDGSVYFSFVTDGLWKADLHSRSALKVGQFEGMLRIVINKSGHGWLEARRPTLVEADFNASPVETHGAVLPAGVSAIMGLTLDHTGAAWAGQGNGGLIHEVGSQWDKLQTLAAGPSSRVLSALAFAADDSLWAADLNSGLYHLFGTGLEKSETIEDPLVKNASVYSLAIDSSGWLWAASDSGLLRYDGQAWRAYGERDGFISNDTNEGALYLDDDQSIWTGTSAGLAHLRPSHDGAARHNSLNIELIKASYGLVDLDTKNVRAVPWNRTASLVLRFSSLSLERSLSSHYQYRIRGLSDSWILTDHPDVTIPALDPNEYNVDLRIIDPHKALESPVLTFSFEVTPPFWMTFWFKGLVMLLLIGAISVAWRFNSQRLRSQSQLRERATRDGLTKLWNRTSILEVLNREVSYANRHGTALALALIDIDHFKLVNDSFGHQAGDAVLNEVARRLSETLRTEDWIGRYGGEEILAIFPSAGEQGLLPVAERLRTCIADVPFEYKSMTIPVTVSLGVAWLTATADSAENLIANADRALYASKENGRNQVTYHREPLIPS